MLAGTPQPARRHRAWIVSAAIHVAVLAALLHQPRPIFVAPSSVARGNSQSSTIVYLAGPRGASTAPPQASTQKLRLPASRPPAAPQPSALAHKDEPSAVANTPQPATVAGTPFGSLAEGPAFGEEVRPALPVVFPDPDIDRSSLPVNLRGDVIVEITIDVRGSVIETHLLQGLEPAIDDKVITAVLSWRFRPATRDGVPIPSKQDVHFHFPA